MTTRRPLIAGNWKMHGLKASVQEFDRMVAAYDAALRARTELMICPPATLIAALAAAAGTSGVAVGGQDCHANTHGAHTGDIAAEMILDAGGSAVILGHSERRTDHGETDAAVRAKTLAAWGAGLAAIVCVGEHRQQREEGVALDLVRVQLAGSIPDGASAANLVVAYEPVWAIGTGLTPSIGDIAEMHGAIRAALVARFGEVVGNGIRILYGGSVKPANAAEILAVADVDGALVGGASLKAGDFMAIAGAYM
ncbi:triose-phosphate isomerase [Ancylobacter sonchi]|uniref:triose-phosphate isomerase n=1 Tax=Ancylobacter sonchi TaxID=1937790 RepID=UPI001BD6119A|nr:triose-phosphate isomerase [Ancylobacter sonchi]MBS7535775.1 triose-phosphate isomerase [Ancylobacter sonchi]